MPPREARPRRVNPAARGALILIALIAAVATLTYIGWRQVPPVSEGMTRSGAEITSLEELADPKPTLLVVGDSFAGGTGDPSFPVFPEIVADRMGWGLALDAQGGTGFVNYEVYPGIRHAPFIERLDHVKATYDVDFILLDGGRNDLGLEPAPVVQAIDTYVRRLRAYWPDAQIIIMTPSYVTTEVADNYPELSNALRTAGEQVGAYLIDPVGEGWYRGIDLKRLLWHDDVHLNREGNEYYADRIVDDLKRWGLK